MKGILRRAAGAVIRWAVVEDDGADRGPIPWQQVRVLDQSGRSVQWYPYGFFAVAPAGSMAVTLRMSNQPDALVHLPGSPRERPKGRTGECGIYHPETGAVVRFVEDGSIVVETPGDVSVDALGSVDVSAGGDLTATVGGTAAVTATVAATITAPAITANGDVTINGDLSVTGDTTLASVVTSAGKDISDSHRHPTTDGGSPGNTGVPV